MAVVGKKERENGHRSGLAAGRKAGVAPEWAGLGAGPGRQGGRRPTLEDRPRPEVRPGCWPNGPAWEPAQAGSEAGGPFSLFLF